MKYEQLIETVSNIVDNESIITEGLILTYTLTDKNHKQMNEELFYKSNPPTLPCVYSDEYEVEIGGLIVKFVKKVSESIVE